MLAKFVYSLRFISCAFACLFAAASASASPGDLDAAFGTAGTVVTDLSTAYYNAARVVLLQPDGKLVAVGVSGWPENVTLIRYNPDGTLDSTFGIGGIVTTLVSKDGSGPQVAILQADGKILVAGDALQVTMQGSNVPLILLRYLPDGELDTQFGSGGIVVLPFVPGLYNPSLIASSIVLEPDGKSIVSVQSNTRGTIGGLVRFNVDGSLDTTFANGGSTNSFSGVAVAQPDGKVIVTGLAPGAQCLCSFVVARYDTSGALDPTFGFGGIAPVPDPASSGTTGPSDLLLQPDGKLLIASRGVPLRDVLVAVRLNPDGSVDDQFANGTSVVTPLGDSLSPTHNPANSDPFVGVVTRLALQPDGKIILIGQPWDAVTAAFHVGMARYNADGTLDSKFGNGGTVIGPVGTLASVVTQPDEKLVVAGANSGFALARFLLDSETRMGLASSLNPSAVNQGVTFSATVIGYAPSGTVQFRDGANSVTGCKAIPLHPGTSGPRADCVAVFASAGAHVVSAAYSGDAFNPPGNTPTLIQVVSAPGTGVAVEYYYEPWNHYFITSLPVEISALDDNVFPGWQRSGESFAVYPDSAPLTVPMCRFFSGESFAPKSSHFYTPYPSECNFVEYHDYPVWGFEDNAMRVALPDTAGNCPAGARPLYRLYNNGQGGAPNHRYTTSLAIRTAMISQGWLPEGAGTIGVIGCVPG